MDVAAVRPDQLDPGDDEPDESGASTGGRRRGSAVRLALPLVVLALLVAATVVLLLRVSDHNAADDARAGALAAAQAEAVNLTTIRYTSAEADLDRIIAGATGKLRQQFVSELAQFPPVLQRQQSVSNGTVLSAAVVSADADAGTAQVVVATDADVSTVGDNGKRESVLKHYRMVMKLQKVGDRWLVSDVAFAGVPQ